MCSSKNRCEECFESLKHEYFFEHREDVYAVLKDVKFVFTAPHAMMTKRKDGKFFSDMHTGPVTEVLADVCNSGLIICRQNNNTPREWEKHEVDGFYANLQTAVMLEKFIVDIHGMKNDHGVDVCIGLGSNPSDRSAMFASALVDNLKEFFTVSVNEPFNAKSLHSVVSYVQNFKGDAIQVELSLNVRESFKKVELLSKAFKNTIAAF